MQKKYIELGQGRKRQAAEKRQAVALQTDTWGK